MYLKTIAESEATGRIAEIYAQEKAKFGFVMAATACWTARADLLPIWEDFFDKVRAGFSLSPRDWRLITFIAAKHAPSTYCSHTSMDGSFVTTSDRRTPYWLFCATIGLPA